MDWRIPLPKIRDIDPIPAIHNRQHVYYLQDPLRLSDSSVIIPQELGAMFMLCDGTRTLKMIQSSLLAIFGIRVTDEQLKELILALDEAYLLNNNRFDEAFKAAQKEFRDSPFRLASHAGNSYPADPDELNKFLDGFIQEKRSTNDQRPIRGVISPHIDFARGGKTYAQTWAQLGSSIEEIELAIIFGTDHYGTGEFFSLTRQDYATPFGRIPTYQPGIDILVEALGEDSAFRGELRHRSEHSVEFAAVWLHHMRKDNPCPILPILCDALPLSDDDPPEPASDEKLNSAMIGLREVIDSKKTLVIGAGDLSHVGPAFGGKPIAKETLDDLAENDHTYIEQLENGEADEFHRLILANDNNTNVCGTAPFVHTMNLLAPSHGKLLDYHQCPADETDTSWVSICGLVLY